MLNGMSISSFENVGFRGCLLNLFWTESDYGFYSGFNNEMHNILCLVNALFTVVSCYTPVQFFFFFLPAKIKQVMQSIFVSSCFCRTVTYLTLVYYFLTDSAASTHTDTFSDFLRFLVLMSDP